MPASMISDVAGDSARVSGRSIAIVAVGPIPGSTPTSVPRSTPMKQKATLTGENAVSKPRPRFRKRSIGVALGAKPRAEKPERQAQPEAEDEDAEHGQAE